MVGTGISAAKGQPRAQKLFLELYKQADSAQQADQQAHFEAAVLYKTYWEDEIDQCRKAVLPIPNPIPHPDDIEIDIRAGTAVIKGPLSKDDQGRWDGLVAHKKLLEDQLNLAKGLLSEEDNPHVRKTLQTAVACAERHLEGIYSLLSGRLKKT